MRVIRGIRDILMGLLIGIIIQDSNAAAALINRAFHPDEEQVRDGFQA